MNRLNLLLREQPDPHQNLTLQSYGHLTEFTCFQRLPAEVRCRIWKMTFPPPRPVCLDRLYPRASMPTKTMGYLHREQYRLARELQKDNHSPMPITLRVNSESRDEALRHYLVLFRNPTQLKGASTLTVALPRHIMKPLCFDPRRDEVFTNFSSLFRGDKYVRWIRLLQSQIKGNLGLHHIHHLEIRDIHWNKFVEAQMRITVFNDLVKSQTLPHFPFYITHRAKTIGKAAELGHFSNLRLFEGVKIFRMKLCLAQFNTSVMGYCGYLGAERESVLNDFIGIIDGYLKQYKECFVGGVLPKVECPIEDIRDYQTSVPDLHRVQSLKFLGY